MQGFSDILGQEAIIRHFTGAMAGGNLSHAYIFSGDEGSGKHLVANRVASALLCTGENERPCGACPSCMQAMAGTNPDIIHVTHEKQNILVDDIREQINKDVAIKPYNGNYKIYIIDEAEKMNEQAQNALLKTLEEPPSYVIIMLLATTTGNFLPTIMSRCLELTLRPVHRDRIASLLIDNYAQPDYMARMCAAFSGGSVGRAVRYATDPDFNIIREEVRNLMSRIDTMNHRDIMEELSFFGEDKQRGQDVRRIEDFFDMLAVWMRDLLMFKATQDPNKLVFQDALSEIRRQSSMRSFENINEVLEALTKARTRLHTGVYFDILMELLLMSLKPGK